ncbi:MAG: hypothetical protein KDD61_12475 [Bdellovibrionales bacterium]|nr:hypothetical protein [Bdellovibrionales bacterium]
MVLRLSKILLVMSVFILGSAYAQKQPGANFDVLKQDAMKNLEARKANLETAMSCVSNAKTPQELRTCRQALQVANQKLRGENQDRRGKRRGKMEN